MVKTSPKSLRPKVVLVIRSLVKNKSGKILLIQRASTDSYMPGKWELPGGKLDVGQDISIALEREVLEETGLVVVPTEKTAYWNSHVIASGKYQGLPYIVLVGITKSLGGTVKISEEHDDFIWTTLKDALEYDLVHESRAALTVLSTRH